MESSMIFIGGLVVFLISISVFLLYIKNNKKKDDKNIQDDMPDKEIKKEEIKEKPILKTKNIPNKIYPDFDIEKPMNELGMNKEEIKEFLQEFIEQINEQKREIVKNIEIFNIEELEKLTHSIKGSSSSLRINGIGDCISDLNNYLRSGNCNIEEIKIYMDDFDFYFEKFKNDENIK